MIKGRIKNLRLSLAQPLLHDVDTSGAYSCRIFFLLFIAAFICHWPDLLNGGVFHDDNIYGVINSPEYSIFQTQGVGQPWFGWWFWLTLFPLSSFKIYCARLTVFGCNIAVGFLLWKTCSRIRFFDSWMAVLLAVLFVVAPAAPTTRIYLTITKYLVCLLLWAIGTYVSVFKKAIGWRIFALICLAISFLTSSLLVFYAVSLLLMLLMDAEHSPQRSITLQAWASKRMDFILLPCVLFILQRIFFPTGDYNALKPIFFLKISYGIFYFLNADVAVIFYLFKKMIFAHWSNIALFILLSAALTPLVMYWMRKSVFGDKTIMLRKACVVLIIACVLFFLAMFPYFAVGKTPLFYDWHSRLQLLLAFPLAFFGLSAVLFVMTYGGKPIAAVVASCIISIFIMVTLYFTIEYQRDWVKELSLREHFHTDSAFTQNNSFLFCDDVPHNALYRQYAWHEYASLYYEANGRYSFGEDIIRATDVSFQHTVDQDLGEMYAQHVIAKDFPGFASWSSAPMAPKGFSIYPDVYVQKGNIVLVNLVVNSSFLSSASLLRNLSEAFAFSIGWISNPDSQKTFLENFLSVHTEIIPTDVMNAYIADYTANGHSNKLNLAAKCGPQSAFVPLDRLDRERVLGFFRHSAFVK